MSPLAPKRFWQTAAVLPAQGGFTIALDDRPVRTPAKAPLVVPVAAWAEGIAAEWDAQVDEIVPDTMPLTQMANVAVDRVRVQQVEVAAMLAAYGASDLLCYRADAPAGLVARQAAQWDPWLRWAGDVLDAPLTQTTGIVPIDQPRASLDRLEGAVRALDPFGLTALHDLVTLSGSLVLGLAVARGACAVDEAWTLSRLDELWQIEQWGADDEAEAMAAAKHAAFARSAQVSLWLSSAP